MVRWVSILGGNACKCTARLLVGQNHTVYLHFLAIQSKWLCMTVHFVKSCKSRPSTLNRCTIKNFRVCFCRELPIQPHQRHLLGPHQAGTQNLLCANEPCLSQGCDLPSWITEVTLCRESWLRTKRPATECRASKWLIHTTIKTESSRSRHWECAREP